MLLGAQSSTVKLEDSIAGFGFTGSAPGCAVGPTSGSEVVFARGYGMADLEHTVPVTPTSAFYIASVSKQFTALATLLLVRDQKLRLEDFVRSHIPELPAHAAEITVRDLIQHTSGMRDYLELLRLSGFRDDRRVRAKDFWAILQRQRGLNFAAGTEHLYSNSGYVLLAALVQRMAGVSLREFANQRIFGPLGMRSTFYGDDPGQLVPNRAVGYSKAGAEWRLNSSTLDLVGDGGVYTTLEDMLRWARSMGQPLVQGRSVIDLMSAEGALRSGQRIRYGMGLESGEVNGHPTLHHGGAFVGYNAHSLYVPSLQIAAVAMCNSSNRDSRAITESLVGALLPKAPVADSKVHSPVPEDVTRRVSGYFRGDRGAYVQLERKGQSLILKTRRNQYELHAESGSELRATKDSEVRIRLDADRKEPIFLRLPEGEQKLTRFSLNELKNGDLSRFAGRYWSDEAQTEIVVTYVSGRLSCRGPSGEEIPLNPAIETEFATGPGRAKFVLSDVGLATAMVLDGARNRGLVFRRMQ
jgi:CubicO group peptidase (beta-lactamase class C family)